RLSFAVRVINPARPPKPPVFPYTTLFRSPAGRAARRQRQGRRVRDPHRPRAQLPDRRDVPLRAQELLLPGRPEELPDVAVRRAQDRKSTRLNSSHVKISYAVFCLKKKNEQ